jgi:hypothetical protein
MQVNGSEGQPMAGLPFLPPFSRENALMLHFALQPFPGSFDYAPFRHVRAIFSMRSAQDDRDMDLAIDRQANK